MAMRHACDSGLLGTAGSFLREELDSMVRTIYLNSIVPDTERDRLLRLVADGSRWPVHDAAMVKDAEGQHGWVKRVYDFGCSCIHLSNIFDYQQRDPFAALPFDDRRVIVEFVNHYHHASLTEASTFVELMAYAPKILDKIASNLEFELEKLEQLY